MHRLNKLISLASLVMVVSTACTTVPEQLKGEYAEVKPMDVSEQNLESQVRWAGVIYAAQPQQDHNCFAVLAKPMNESMRPQMTDQSDGRFIACVSGDNDPNDIQIENEVTLTGRIFHIDKRQIENSDYLIPVVEVDSMTLWPVNMNPGRPYMSVRLYDQKHLASPHFIKRDGPSSHGDSIFWASTNN